EKLCNLSSVLVCVSEAEKRKLSKMYPQYEEKIEVVHNGITYDISTSLNDNYKRSRKVFGYIGRTDYRKGIYESVKAFSKMDVKYRLACPKNDVSYVERILNYIDAANMWDKVEFCGWCVGERKESFLNSLDALVIPSLYEPFGYVALEAMQRGLPVICSNNGGLDEILEGYKYKYSPYVEGELEKIIREFMEDSVETVEEQQMILITNLERFSATNMVSRYNRIWNKLLEESL
ncbi:MAG: glycosyltransferase family 4 protein, partial [Lachnospiraceae bacterium]|nr:glycosyltransferase family 4 protein [Lachnospiraceae bacterium]